MEIIKKKIYSDSEIKLYPLVSIFVITYNSSEYVFETLESAKMQTYQNIELIISDDCSKDDTVIICQKWLEINSKRFVRCQLITVPENTGIPANCNRGLKAIQGEWVKIIAGDDALTNDCIEANINYLNKNQEIKVLQTKSNIYEDTFIESNLLGSAPINTRTIHFSKKSLEQYKILLKMNFIQTPSMFLNTKVLNEVGGFDEDFRLFEDIPLWLKLTKAGYKVYFLDKVTVKYRVHNNSVAKQSKPHVSSKFLKESYSFKTKYIWKDISLLLKLKYTLKFKILVFLDKNGFNKNNKFCNFIYKLVQVTFR